MNNSRLFYSSFLTLFLFAVFVLVEIVYVWRYKKSNWFHDKFTFWFYLSAVLLLIRFACKIPIISTSIKLFATSVTAILIIDILSFFSMMVYIIFRGLLVWLELFGENEKHPVFIMIKKLILHPLRAYLVAGCVTLFIHIGAFVIIFVSWLIASG